MRYIKPKNIDKSFLGRFVHFDFFRNSHYGELIDTVSITIDNKPIRFFEVRTDNGLNQWFYAQGLQSVEKYNGQTIKISQCRLDTITAEVFLVTLYVDYYQNKQLIKDKSRLITYSFNKKDIVEVLVHDE